MIIEETIKDTIKAEVLKQLGNPTHYYDYFIADDEKGYELREELIEKIELDSRLCGGYNIKINGRYATQSYFMFDRKAAEEFVRKQNIDYWKKKIEKAQEFLDTIDARVIKEKAQQQATIEIAKLKLVELNATEDKSNGEG